MSWIGFRLEVVCYKAVLLVCGNELETIKGQTQGAGKGAKSALRVLVDTVGAGNRRNPALGVLRNTPGAEKWPFPACGVRNEPERSPERT